ncbi:zinc finger protein 37 [Phakopsora pachyrhizi]|uniref:Zinc finger protein 37 n=1 Tax=Phakopsora pachyrhizi TaxID=170000 RepID=A0AAV0AH20_PHAPC|nr:zinc finger protein 37 [Phakopsora pachyrhizi]CAH7667655.1 zinc finger protein 37 [Phakopsora pachyrhizi]
MSGRNNSQPSCSSSSSFYSTFQSTNHHQLHIPICCLSQPIHLFKPDHQSNHLIQPTSLSSDINQPAEPAEPASSDSTSCYSELWNGFFNLHPSVPSHHNRCVPSDRLSDNFCCSDQLCAPPLDHSDQLCNIPNCHSSLDRLDSGRGYHLPLRPYTPVNTSCCSVPPAFLTNPTPTTLPSTPSSPTNQRPSALRFDTGCECCEAGCPPSSNLPDPCLDCVIPPPPSPCSQNNRSEIRLKSPSLGSCISTSDHDLNPSTPTFTNEAISDDIVWINKELEELIKCCCCDEPTPSASLPAHHLDAHPAHHVHFNRLGNTSTSQLPLNSFSHSTSPTPVVSTFNFGSRPTPKPSVRLWCQWKDCNREFASQNSLVEHVNNCHLFQNSNIPTPNYGSPRSSSFNLSCCNPTSTLSPSLDLSDVMFVPRIVPSRQDGQESALELLLAGCGASPCDPQPGDTTASSFPTSSANLSASCPTRTNHNSPLKRVRDNYSEVCTDSVCNTPKLFTFGDLSGSTSSPAPKDYGFQSQNSFYDRSSPVEARSNAKTLAQKEPKKNVKPEKVHLCRWEGCRGRMFESTAELTKHISSEHVGSGKSKYMCKWEGCCCGEAIQRTTGKTKEEEEEEEERKLITKRKKKSGTSVEYGDGERPRKTFNQRQKVMRHLQVHTGDRPFLCEVCDKRFGEMATLIQHRRTHTNEKPYKCQHPNCGKSFALQSALTIHSRTHSGLKPFRCHFEGCKASFSESSNLSKHLRTHTGVKPFECERCGKRFSRSDQLIRHKKIHLRYDTAKKS